MCHFVVDTNSGQVGLAINQSFTLSGFLQFAMRQWAELENQMTSVERLLEYEHMEAEDKSGEEPDNWPENGQIRYQDVNLKYHKGNELILKQVNFVVEPGQKIGIIGRTGAGKTSIISALFRLYDLESGSITIDERDISKISLNTLRSEISVIPQNPVLFSGTLRSNLDPYNKLSDEELWKTLKSINIKGLIDLNEQIEEAGSKYSTGQKQLLCLARTIIRNNKIVVLDEATASMDPETDALVENIIENQFSGKTMLVIAHKLASVLKCDKVMVVDDGRVVEFDKPSVLMKNSKSTFYFLISRSGLINKFSQDKSLQL